MAAIEIETTDGVRQVVRMTALDNMKAEDKAQREGWNYNGVRSGMYAVYSHLRQTGKTALPFEQWAGTVVATREVSETPGESATAPDGQRAD